MFKPFAEETGIKVIDTSTPNVDKIKAQVDTGNVEWDCVYTSLNYFYNLGPQYFEPIDYSLPIRLSPTPTICSVHPFS